MARHSQPLQNAKLKGSVKKRPGRYKDVENIPTPSGPLGQPPAYMRPEVKLIWHELESDIPMGVLTRSDRLLFEFLCQLTYEFRNKPSSFKGNKYTTAVGIAARFGMSGSDRQKLRLPGEGKPKNRFEKFNA